MEGGREGWQDRGGEGEREQEQEQEGGRRRGRTSLRPDLSGPYHQGG
jgi:hypothetical protein